MFPEKYKYLNDIMYMKLIFLFFFLFFIFLYNSVADFNPKNC
jgi:hypothetical protein